MEDYCFNQPDIVNYPFHWSEEAGKDISNFATLAFDLGHKPQGSSLELHDLYEKFLDFQHTANTRFLSERKDKETDFKWFKVLLKLRCIDLILSIGIGSDTGIFCWIVYRSDETDPNPILSEDYSVLLLSPKRGTKTL